MPNIIWAFLGRYSNISNACNFPIVYGILRPVCKKTKFILHTRKDTNELTIFDLMLQRWVFAVSDRYSVGVLLVVTCSSKIPSNSEGNWLS